MKIREILTLLAEDEWRQVRRFGAHRQFRHESKRGLLAVAGSGGDDVAPGALNSILKQAGLKP